MTVLAQRISKFRFSFRKMIFRSYSKKKFKPWSVIFFGSDEFSSVSLQVLVKCKMKKTIDKLEVVTLNENNTVAKAAVENNLKLHLWPPTFSDSFDLGIIVSFGKLIPKNIIDYFPLGVINVHASLLPQYRGAAPIIHALKNGDSVTGITVLKIQPFVYDTGDIVLQETCEIGPHELMPSLRRRLAYQGAKCLQQIIDGLPCSLENCIPQATNFTLAPKINKALSVVLWDKMTSLEIYNLHRALFGLHDLTTTFRSQKVKLFCISLDPVKKSKIFSENKKLPPGSIEYSRKSHSLRVHCMDDCLYVCTVMVNGKIQLASDFYCGYLNRVPKEDWFFT